MLEKCEMKNFTAFGGVSLVFCPGVNLFIGENGSGKTHILKLLYTALDSYQGPDSADFFAQKMINVFLPKDYSLGRLVRRVKGSSSASVTIVRDNKPFTFQFTNHSRDKVICHGNWKTNGEEEGSCVFIPVKEMLANAPGFRSLYDKRLIYFEEIYFDILSHAYLPLLRGAITDERKILLDMLQKVMKGRVIQKGEQFFLKNKQGELEFPLLAEGIRKFALLWLLIQNGTLLKGSTLFWDEPEANINPSMIKTLVEIMLHLQTLGVQIFVATHSYLVLREFDLQRNYDEQTRYFSLSFTPSGDVNSILGGTYTDILPNKINEAYMSIYDKEVERALKPIH